MALSGYFTNRGLKIILGVAMANTGVPANWKLALCQAVNEQTLDAEAVVNKGSGKVGIQCDGHGFSVGDRIVVEGSDNYDGAHIVDATTTTNEIVIAATYAAETMAGTETVHEAPSPDTNVLTDLSEVPVGNGYSSGGATVARNLTTGFDSLSEEDAEDRGLIQLQDVVFTASGGSLPSSGNGARYAVLTDDSANVICWWDLGGNRVVSAGQTLQVQDAELSLEFPAEAV